jgi:hypothetical protein
MASNEGTRNFSAGSRTERPHSDRGWTSDREANYAEKPCPKGCTGKDNPGGFHVGRSRGHRPQ